MKTVFDNIYKNKIWYKGSGSGSLVSNTKDYISFLEEYIVANQIKRIVDLGCGDWQFSKTINWDNLHYLGVDLVESVIENNIEKFSQPNIRFECVDVLSYDLPSTDLIIIKDVLQHWPNQEVINFLNKIKHVDHILINNTISGDNLNSDIKVGDMRPIDLSQAPFNLNVKQLLTYNSLRPIAKVSETKQVVSLI
jgi:2-polyprenyl-3-methyl-5-hydroxy-6-metoxy-1,4-benzoquinol methylase